MLNKMFLFGALLLCPIVYLGLGMMGYGYDTAS